MEVAVFRNTYAHGSRRIHASAANRLQDVGIKTPARGDLVPLDYPTVKRFRARLRELMNLGGVGQEAVS